ncbi:ATP-binding protein [Novosphingobium sp. PS1R-30]|uniref:ATP-binding protein n=1 Tax=Novosphingobium anseongense TaxID=3133436 RepID=A0ABU8RXG1_9SPHN|nr:MAG: ATP-binding protein [Novosphingobium sp.]
MPNFLRRFIGWLTGDTADAGPKLLTWIGDEPLPEKPAPAPAPVSAPVIRHPASKSQRVRIVRAFDSSMPVEDRSGLSGRGTELSRLTNAVIEQGKHALVFGGRGSGKTSLSRVFGELADEARFLVLYHSVSGDLDFRELMAPFVHELVAVASQGRRSIVAPEGGASARLLADWMALHFDQDIVLLLDEFDRIRDPRTKEELASLMKLLSDMRLPIRLFIIGIAGDIEELVVGHPSLRRHMEAIQLGTISRADLDHLLDHCCAVAGMTIDRDAREVLVRAAMGSAYHLRLFGMHAALRAEERQSLQITEAEVGTGLTKALLEWAMISRETHDWFRHLLNAPGAIPDQLGAVAVLASYAGQFDGAAVADALRSIGVPEHQITARSETLMQQLERVTDPVGSRGARMFRDNLSAQFLMLMVARRQQIFDEEVSHQRHDMSLAFQEVGEAFR